MRTTRFPILYNRSVRDGKRACRCACFEGAHSFTFLVLEPFTHGNHIIEQQCQFHHLELEMEKTKSPFNIFLISLTLKK